jgi:hypothetical protein
MARDQRPLMLLVRLARIDNARANLGKQKGHRVAAGLADRLMCFFAVFRTEGLVT